MVFDAILSYTSCLFLLTLAGIAILRQKSSFVHWVFALGLMLFSAEQLFSFLGRSATDPSTAARWQYWSLISASFLPGIWLLFSTRFARAETGGLWRWVTGVLLVVLPAMVLITGASFFPGQPLYDFENGTGWVFRLASPGYAFYLLCLIAAILVLFNLERTLRSISGRIRWQVKYLLLGVGTAFGLKIYLSSQAILFSTLDPKLEILQGPVLVVAGLLIAVGLFRTPVLHLDLYISPTLLHRSIIVVIVAAYLIAVALLAELLSRFSWLQTIPVYAFLILVGMISVVVILLSDRLQLWIRHFMVAHLRQPQHDYRGVWTRFTEATASVFEAEVLSRRVARLISSVLESPSVTIWEVDERRRILGLLGSTSLTLDEARRLHGDDRIPETIIRGMAASEDVVVDVEVHPPECIQELRRIAPDYLDQARVRYVAGLKVGDALVGILMVSDRVKRRGHSFEELELLQLMADQTAAALLNLRLSSQVQDLKQIEAFQKMSAFLLHDLKNLASRFSLTAGNLARHFDKPDFREHAQKTLNENVKKIRAMCNQLTMLRGKLELNLAPADLNDLIRQTLDELQGSLGCSAVQQLESISEVRVDREQFQKVLVNLLLNADEASDRKGEVRISTFQENGHVILSVSDSGCGMSRDYLQNRLFRPFETTKQQGMGIGLFHSKLIVELHKGNIEVESEEGKGTTFQVFLPI